MLSIADQLIRGQHFYSSSNTNNTEYTCIGFGQNPASGVDYVIGMDFDSTNNRTIISTHLLKNVTFKGNLLPKVP